MDYGTFQGLVAAGCGIVLFLMGYYKGRISGAASALDTLIAMRMLKINNEGNVVKGDKLDLE